MVTKRPCSKSEGNNMGASSPWPLVNEYPCQQKDVLRNRQAHAHYVGFVSSCAH
jgi:hypothetical protein